MNEELELLREKKGFICDMDGVIYHAVSRPANAVRGIKYAICLHNRTHKAGGAHRRAFRGRPCSRQPQNPAGISAPRKPVTPRSA